MKEMIVTEDGNVIAQAERYGAWCINNSPSPYSDGGWKANAAHIVKCVNEREELLGALRDIRSELREGWTTCALEKLDALLTRAEQEG